MHFLDRTKLPAHAWYVQVLVTSAVDELSTTIPSTLTDMAASAPERFSVLLPQANMHSPRMKVGKGLTISIGRSISGLE
jgi:hypothetical protein